MGLSSAASGSTDSAILKALSALGNEDETKPETVDAARVARVLLETQPPATLVSPVIPLWRKNTLTISAVRGAPDSSEALRFLQ